MTLIITAATVAIITSGVIRAEARPRPRRASNFEANKSFGLGIMLGAPAGLSGKYFLTKDTALDFGVGAYHRYRFDNAVQVHLDYLLHPVNLVKTPPFHLPLYFGIGGRLLLRQYDNRNDDDVHLGVRIPVGISMDFNNVPIDIFAELAFIADLVVAGDDRFFHDFNGLIGLRYYFE